jgi:hypothetical protein
MRARSGSALYSARRRPTSDRPQRSREAQGQVRQSSCLCCPASRMSSPLSLAGRTSRSLIANLSTCSRHTRPVGK